MMSSCWQVIFFSDGGIDEKTETFLSDYFEVLAQNYDDAGNDEYVGYCSGELDEEKMLIASREAKVILPKYKIEKLESDNWLKDYVIKFAPFEVEDFMIYGIHESQAPQTQKIALQIYAATAFGSDHQTTRSCLKAICELYHQQYVPAKILDVGTGSGILSLAAASLWKDTKIIAVDIDEEAVLVTQSNAQNNNLDNKIQVAQSDGYQAEIVKQNAKYDLILANILARPLTEMATSAAASLKKGGFIILSGFVEEQFEWVIEEHQKCGLELVKTYELDNWRAVVMKKE